MRWLGEQQPPDQAIRQVITAADRLHRVGRRMPAEASAAPVSAPVTADTQRQSATYGDRDSEADWHVAMVPDTARHAGWGLHNRRLQVRFLSHLPLVNPEFIWAAAIWRAARFA